MSERNKHELSGDDLAAHDAPTWFTHSLELAADYELFLTASTAAPEPFLRQCEEAATGALAVLKMRRRQVGKGFWPTTLADHLDTLAEEARVSLSGVLAVFKAGHPAQLDEQSAGPLGKLCREIGLSLAETLTYARLTIAAARQPESLQVLTARCRRTAPARPLLAECDAVLRECEAGYEAAALQSLVRIEAALGAAYHADEAQEG